MGPDRQDDEVSADANSDVTPGSGSAEGAASGDLFAGVGRKALAAVGAGVGVLGFVTLVGGAIFYAQMSAVGLPSDQAVSAIPQSTLLVVGARLLVPVLIVVLAWIAALWAVEEFRARLAQRTNGAQSGESDAEKPASKTAAKRWWVRSRDYTLARDRQIGAGLLCAVGIVGAWVDFHKANPPWSVYPGALIVGSALLAVIWVVGIHGDPAPSFWRFAWVSVIAAAIFVAAGGTVLASVAPAVRAVVVARKSGPPIAGIYAAANSTEVLVGEVCEDRNSAYRGSKRSGVLLVIPRSDITTMVLSTNASVDDVLIRQAALLADVGGGSSGATQPIVSKRTKTPCTAALSQQLDSKRQRGVPGVLQGP